jgi:hypothetical protein
MAELQLDRRDAAIENLHVNAAKREADVEALEGEVGELRAEAAGLAAALAAQVRGAAWRRLRRGGARQLPGPVSMHVHAAADDPSLNRFPCTEQQTLQ